MLGLSSTAPCWRRQKELTTTTDSIRKLTAELRAEIKAQPTLTSVVGRYVGGADFGSRRRDTFEQHLAVGKSIIDLAKEKSCSMIEEENKFRAAAEEYLKEAGR